MFGYASSYAASGPEPKLFICKVLSRWGHDDLSGPWTNWLTTCPPLSPVEPPPCLASGTIQKPKRRRCLESPRSPRHVHRDTADNRSQPDRLSRQTVGATGHGVRIAAMSLVSQCISFKYLVRCFELALILHTLVTSTERVLLVAWRSGQKEGHLNDEDNANSAGRGCIAGPGLGG